MPVGGYGLGIPASGISGSNGLSPEPKTTEQALAQLARVKSFFEKSSLRVLNLSQNRIQDLKDVYRLGELKELRSVALAQTPFSRKSWYRHQLISQIPRLTVLDGVDVTEDEIERVRALLQQGDGPEDFTQITTSAPLGEREAGGRPRKQVI